jgi:uncharacterized hydrophobic protein (TIGR00341 family)
MALRLIELFMPAEGRPRLQESLGHDGVVAHWTEQISEQQTLVRVLLQVEYTEPFMDRLEEILAGTDFRAMLVSVEATIPRLEADREKRTAAELAASKEAGTDAAPGPRISREELYQQVNEGAQLTRTFVVLVALSAVVAAVGVAYDNITVVIGAMVIAPLLGPNVALSLATTLGDTDLAKFAAKTNIVGILVTLAVAIPIGFLVEVDPRVAEIQTRIHVQLKDVVLALASGSAGVLSMAAGASAALIGVMVAVALLPPLVTFGLLVGAGHTQAAMGALLLFITNVICVNLAGIVTLLAQNVRPRTWWEEGRAKKATKIAISFWFFLLLMLVIVILLLQRGQ